MTHGGGREASERNGIGENERQPEMAQLAAVVVVIISPLPRNGGTARTAIQVHAVNLIAIRLGERWQPTSN